MAGRRPRRVAPVSYAHLYKPIKLPDDDSDDDAALARDRSGAAPVSSASRPGSAADQDGHGEGEDDDDETSVSEYDASVARSEEQQESADDLADEAVPSDALGETSAGDDDDDATHEHDKKHSDRPHQVRTGRASGARTMVTKTIPTAKASQSRHKRARLHNYAANTGYHTSLLALAPQFQPPVRRLARADQADSSPPQVKVGPALDDIQRSNVLEAWTLTPYGPETELVHDAGWWTSKWDYSRGDMHSRWGKWHTPKSLSLDSQTIPADQPEKMDEIAAGASVPEIRADVDADGANADAASGDSTTTPGGNVLKVWIPKRDCSGHELIILKRSQTVRLGIALVHAGQPFALERPSFILNVGGMISGLDWCPQPDSNKARPDYLAIATLSAPGSAIASSAQTKPSCLQIWQLKAGADDAKSSASHLRLRFGMCIEHEVLDLKWCPQGGTEPYDSSNTHRSIGTIACVLSNGTIAIFLVPQPETVGVDDNEHYFLARPVRELRLPDTTVVSLAWGSHTRIAGGCENGYVAVWDLIETDVEIEGG
ncbi:hypothetical protein OIV83_001088 [Microbotryomycetes sp. JL201]|nr:hypothetical protein OIV83_001088 [Microbotryomycetes sp. JL201]